MSGSSGPDITIGSAGSGEDCWSLRLSRWVEGPVPGVADQLAVGDVLNVDLREGTPVIVALVNGDGADVGSIVPTARLLGCLRDGVPFAAEIESASGGSIKVEVRAAAA
jgi:hypothetical protein